MALDDFKSGIFMLHGRIIPALKDLRNLPPPHFTVLELVLLLLLLFLVPPLISFVAIAKMTSKTPSTPFRPPQARRILEPSPSFSNYFSDDDPSSPRLETSSLNASMDATPLQKKLLARLHEIGQQILRKDVDDHARVLNAGIDALNETLTAPDPQTRKPAEVEDSGLFMDDDDEIDDEVESASLEAELSLEREEAEKADDHTARAELNERLTQVVQDLQDRYEEVKVRGSSLRSTGHFANRTTQHINQLLVSHLETTENQISELTTENETLRREMSQADSDMLYLKMQLRALEVEAEPHLDTAAGAELRQGIERWKEDWKAARNQSPHPSRRQDSAIDGLGIDSTEDGFTATSANGSFGSPQSPKTKLTITRPGIISRHSSDPFVDVDVPAANGTSKEAEEVAPTTHAINGVSPAPDAVVKELQIELESLEASPQDSPRAIPSKTPWEELWDSLAALSGMQGD
jgi:hypothetical protein